jgi:hypothetical protein
MINPDGVVGGLYRKTLDGYDLNRQWEKPDKILQPTLYYIKEHLAEIIETNTLAAIFDLHGHSSSKNCFLYGCECSPYESDFVSKNFQIKEFLKLLAKSCPFISYNQSSLKVTKDKEGTARVVFRRQFNVDKTFTLETSAYGSDALRDSDDIHFTISHLGQIGESLIRCIALYTFGCNYHGISDIVDNNYVNNFIKSKSRPKKSKIRIHIAERSRENLVNSLTTKEESQSQSKDGSHEKSNAHSSIITLHFHRKVETNTQNDYVRSSLPSIDAPLPSLAEIPKSKDQEKCKKIRVCSLHYGNRLSKVRLKNYDFNIDVSISHAVGDVKSLSTGKASQKYGKRLSKDREHDKHVSSSYTKALRDEVPSYYSRLFPVVQLLHRLWRGIK